MTTRELHPSVLCIGGHDPSGGAGVQADAEAARAAGVHACTAITCTTCQDTRGVRRLWPQAPGQVDEPCRLILADGRVGAIKVGLLGSSAMVRVVARLVADHPGLPLVLDPVLTSGAGDPLADAALLNQLRINLLKHSTLVTPNLPEAQSITGARSVDDCAERLLAAGCRWVLITGTHAASRDVVNRLYGRAGARHAWSWPRLPGEYHGSGCTLAAAVAARLAAGADMVSAVDQAQRFTWDSLERAWRTGRGAFTPNRLHGLD